jgi:hypothetical protein
MKTLAMLLVATSLFTSCAMFGKGCCKKKQDCGDKKECELKKDSEKKPCCMGSTDKDK